MYNHKSLHMSGVFSDQHWSNVGSRRGMFNYLTWWCIMGVCLIQIIIIIIIIATIKHKKISHI